MRDFTHLFEIVKIHVMQLAQKSVLSLELNAFAFVMLDIGVINANSLVVIPILVRIKRLANQF